MSHVNTVFYLNQKLAQLKAAGATQANGQPFTSIVEVEAAIRAAGLTVAQHFNRFGDLEGLSPNANFDVGQYLAAKAAALNANGGTAPNGTSWNADLVKIAFNQAGIGAWQHFARFGSFETAADGTLGINPSNSFDISKYYADKAAALTAAGMTSPSGDTVWTSQEVVDAFKASNIDAVTHFIDFGGAEGLVPAAVPAGEAVQGGTNAPVNAGQTFTLTTSVDNLPGTSGNDTYVGVLGGPNATLTALDVINGGDGVDTLNVLDTVGSGNILPLGLQLTGVEIVNGRSVGEALIDTTTFASVTKVNVTQGIQATVIASDMQDVSVSGISGEILLPMPVVDSGDIDVDGGKDVSVVVGNGTHDITIGAMSQASGNITVTDTAQNDGVILVDGGVDVSVTATTANVDSGVITVGGNTVATGAVAVTQNLNSNGVAAQVGGAITVTGGSTVAVNVNANSSASAFDSDEDIAIGTITVNGDGTTDVTVKQNAVANTVTKAAVAAVPSTVDVTFKALSATESVEVGGLTFTAAKDLTAEQVAAAFAGLTAGGDIQDDGGIVSNGTYSGILSVGISSGSASGAVVTFSGAAGIAVPVAVDSSAPASVPTTANANNGSIAVAADTSENTVALGSVVVTDNAVAAIKTVTLDGFSGATLTGTTVLETLSLSNGDGVIEAASAATLALSLNDINVAKAAANTITLTGTETLNLNLAGFNATNIFANDVKALNISGSGELDAGDGSLGAIETIVVSGSVTTARLVDPDLGATLKSIDTTANTGSTTFVVSSDASYAGGAGSDTVTLNVAALTKNISLGAGDDRLNLAQVPTGTGLLDGGAGSNDTLGLTSGDAQLVDNDNSFNARISGFEVLAITNPAVLATVNLDNIDGINRVTLEAGGTIQLDNFVSGGTVTFTGSQALNGATVNVKDAATGMADVVNFSVVRSAPISAGLTANNVETVNVNSVGAVHSIGIAGDKIQTIVLTGGDVFFGTSATTPLPIVPITTLTTVDGSALTGGLNYIANGAVAGTTVMGGMGRDFLQSSGENDVLMGGAGDDTFIAGDLAQLFGGAGKDTFVFNINSNLAKVSTINDFSTGDVINTGADFFYAEGAQFNANTATTIEQRVNAAVQQTNSGEATWFNFGGNTYIVIENAATAVNGVGDVYVAGEDTVIELIGTFNLGTGASFSTSAGTLELA